MSWLRAFLNRWLVSSKWPAVAVSEAVRRWSIRKFDISPDRIRLLYTAIDVDPFASPPPGSRDRIRGEFALGDETPVLGLVGRLDVAQKGQDLMIRAMALLRARHPDAVLLLVGDGPDRARLEALVHEVALDEVVRFAGHRYDVADILAAVDVAVVPSVCEEAFGFVALEASGAGRPVVAFRSGGLPEVVLHDQTGIVVPKGDVAVLSEAIARILDDPDLAGRFGEAGRRHAARFGLSRHVSEVMDFCESVLEEHHHREPRCSGTWREKPTD